MDDKWLNAIDGAVNIYGLGPVLAFLADRAERDVNYAIEEEHDRVKAGRLHSVQKDLQTMANNLRGVV